MKKIRNFFAVLEADIEAAITPALKQEVLDDAKAVAAKLFNAIEAAVADFLMSEIEKKAA